MERQPQAKVQRVTGEGESVAGTLLTVIRMSFPVGNGSVCDSAAHWRVDPSFIICDESVAALDVSIQAQVLNLLIQFTGRVGLYLYFYFT